MEYYFYRVVTSRGLCAGLFTSCQVLKVGRSSQGRFCTRTLWSHTWQSKVDKKRLMGTSLYLWSKRTIKRTNAKREAPLGPCARPVPWPHEGLPLLPVVENEFYGYKIIICMLWLVKQSTLTWLLLTFMFPRTLFKLQSAMSSPDLSSPAAQPSPGQPGQFSDSGEIRNFAKCLHIVHALCSLLGPPSGTGSCWRGKILLNRDPAAKQNTSKI